MDLKVFSAVLVALLVIAVGMDVYDKDMSDLTDFSDIFRGLRGIFTGIDDVEEVQGSTNVSVDVLSHGNISEIEYSGLFNEISLKGEFIDVNLGSMSTSSESVFLTNISADVSVTEDNVSIEGVTNHLMIGDNEFVIEEPKNVRIKSKFDYIFLDNLTNIDLTFSNVSGSIDTEDQYMEFEKVPLELEKFSGKYKRDTISYEPDDMILLEGKVVKGVFGKEGSRTRFGEE